MGAPDVQILITPRADSELVEFVVMRTGRHLPLVLPVGTLETCRSAINDALRQFKDDIGDTLGPPTDLVRQALLNLFMNTAMVCNRLTGNGPVGLQELRDVFVEALPDWETREDVPVVQVEGPSYGFPFELLPVFDTSNPGDMAHVEAFARRFLGFSTAVRRLPYVAAGGRGLAVGQSLKTRPLWLSFAWFASMAGARAEREFFATLRGHVEVNGPWPAPSQTREKVLNMLVDGLVNPERRYETKEFGPEVQIVHFACHCDTGFDNVADYELELCGEDGDSHFIKLGLLNMHFGWGLDADPAARTRPLVFLNACGSAHMDPRRAYSWPEFFLQTGHRSVIGPETLIPDEVASRFARFFYRTLFSRCSVGDALVLARRELLHQFGNPLGLLYVLYGDSAVTVDQPIPQEVLDG